VSGSGISWAICKSAPRPRQITTPASHRSVILQAWSRSGRAQLVYSELDIYCSDHSAKLWTHFEGLRTKYFCQRLFHMSIKQQQHNSNNNNMTDFKKNVENMLLKSEKNARIHFRALSVTSVKLGVSVGVYRVRLKNTPLQNSYYFQNNLTFLINFSLVINATSAANVSISTLVFQKQHRFKHKRRFSQVNRHKIRLKSFYTQILSYGMFQMQKKRQSWHAGNITDWMIDLYNECSKCLPPVLMQVSQSVQTLAKAGD